MAHINIIGAGPGNPIYLTTLAMELIQECHVLIGDKRLLKSYEDSGKTLIPMTNASEIQVKIREFNPETVITVLVSGDAGFYSLSKTLLPKLKDLDVLVVPGISSIQLMAASLGMSWDDAALLSMHGRKEPFLSTVAKHKKTFFLLDKINSPSVLCQQFLDFGLEDLIVHVGKNLSYDSQRIVSGSPKEFINQPSEELEVMVVENKNPICKCQISQGIGDEQFVRSNVPMTKQEIRAISLAKLNIGSQDVLYDVGAGTGSVAIEMALSAPDGLVYAIEKNKEGIRLIEENKAKFGTFNLKAICGEAPGMLEALPKPDRVFIGGSSHHLNQILDVIYDKNEEALVVINAVTIETLSESTQYYKEHKAYEIEIVSVSIAKSEEVGTYHMMKGQNPIYIITAKKRTEELL